jgi:hypothetical protein
MTVAQKLQLGPGQVVRVLGAPPDASLDVPQAEGEGNEADAVLLFVHTRAELAERAGPVVQAARRDALAWVAYPKAGKLGTDLNRDSLAAALTERGVRPVRQVAIDDVWSALRFRTA